MTKAANRRTGFHFFNVLSNSITEPHFRQVNKSYDFASSRDLLATIAVWQIGQCLMGGRGLCIGGFVTRAYLTITLRDST
jgi:hypothetical protein